MPALAVHAEEVDEIHIGSKNYGDFKEEPMESSCLEKTTALWSSIVLGSYSRCNSYAIGIWVLKTYGISVEERVPARVEFGTSSKVETV